LRPRGRQRRLAIAVLFALVFSAGVVAVTDTARISAISRGDFPAFYSLAVIARSGNTAALYDIALQTRVQNKAWPSMNGSVLPAAYPPYIAYLLQPLAFLSPELGKVVWTAGCFLIFLVAMRVLSNLQPRFQGYTLELAAGLLLFMPILMGILSGQLLAASLLVYVSILSFEKLRSKRGDLLLGVAIGAWLFKPQYALLALAIPLLQGRWRVLLGFAFVGGLCFALGSQVMGVLWLKDWIEFAGSFAEMNFASNAGQMPNLVGATIALMDGVGVSGDLHTIGKAIALGGCAALVGYLLRLAWLDRTGNTAGPSRALLLLGSVAALGTPQANFYDLGLAVISLLLLNKTPYSRALSYATGLLIFGALATVFRLDWLPLFCVLAGVVFVLAAGQLAMLAKTTHSPCFARGDAE